MLTKMICFEAASFQNRPIVSSAFSELSLTSVRIKEGTNDKFYGLVCFSKIQAQIFRLVVSYAAPER